MRKAYNITTVYSSMVSLVPFCVFTLAGMASLVEFQDFNLNLPHHSVIMPTIPEMQTLEEIMAQDVEPLPTPPLSPEHMCPSPSSESSHDLDSADNMDITEALLNEMMQYEQLLVDVDVDENGIFANGQSIFALEGNFLVQDCMWNSHSYKPRNIISVGTSGLFTPAPSPPPTQQLPAAEENDQAEGEDEIQTLKEEMSSESSSSDQTDCISPNDVFPSVLMPKDETTKKTKQQPTRHTRQERTRRAMEREQRSSRGGERTSSIITRRASANTNGNSRVQPQASASSESGK